jgi:hypothetical protein
MLVMQGGMDDGRRLSLRDVCVRCCLFTHLTFDIFFAVIAVVARFFVGGCLLLYFLMFYCIFDDTIYIYISGELWWG